MAAIGDKEVEAWGSKNTQIPSFVRFPGRRGGSVLGTSEDTVSGRKCSRSFVPVSHLFSLGTS